jgi:hypothetical protein
MTESLSIQEQINKLKAEAYDILALIQGSEMKLNSVNQSILKLNQELAKENTNVRGSIPTSNP